MGNINARRLVDGELGAGVSLPADYVSANVELAYVSTVNGSQGRTVDVGNGLVDPEHTSLEAMYVEVTRGREMNRLFVPITLDEQGNVERSAIDILTEVMERRSAALSATEAKREQDDAARSTARIGPVWVETTVQLLAVQHRDMVAEALGPELMARLDGDSAAPAFWTEVGQTYEEGYDVADVLRSTLAGREVQVTADSVAQVLHYRLENMTYMRWEPALRGAVVDQVISQVDTALIAAEHGHAVAAALGPQLASRLAGDNAAPAFWHQVAKTHAKGYDVGEVLRSTLAGREVEDTAKSVAQVLHYRLENMASMKWEPVLQRPADQVALAHLDGVSDQAGRRSQPASKLTYLERSPEPESIGIELVPTDPLAAYSRRLAIAMDARVEELGHRTAASPPEWAVEHLGPPPVAGSSAYEEWVAKASVVEAYREQ